MTYAIHRAGPLGLEKLCSSCRQWLPATDQIFRRKAKEGYLRSHCRDCERSKARKHMRAIYVSSRPTAEQIYLELKGFV